MGCGGFGFPLVMWGLALDTVTAAQVVLANGTIVTASGTQNADLFFVSTRDHLCELDLIFVLVRLSEVLPLLSALSHHSQ